MQHIQNIAQGMSYLPASKGVFRLRHILETYTFFGTIPSGAAFCETIRGERQARRHSAPMIKCTKPAGSKSCPQVLTYIDRICSSAARYAKRGNRRLAHTNRILNYFFTKRNSPLRAIPRFVRAIAKRGRKERVVRAITGFSPGVFGTGSHNHLIRKRTRTGF